MGLMTPRFGYEVEDDRVTVIDRWKEYEPKEFASAEDARQYAEEQDKKVGHSMLIVFTPEDGGMTEIIAVIPCTIFTGDDRRHYLHAYDLENGIPGDRETWFRNYPISAIRAWDV